MLHGGTGIVAGARLMAAAVMSVFAAAPRRVGGIETFVRELSSQLAESGTRSILCFLEEPPERVRRFIELPNVSIEVLPDVTRRSLNVVRDLSGLLKKYRPGILHLHFMPVVSPYPWLGRLYGVGQNYATDHISRPEGHWPARSAWWKRAIARTVNRPLTAVITVSDYNAREWAVNGMVRADRVRRIYNGVDLRRAGGAAALFREKYGIRADRPLIMQVSWLIPEKGIADLLETARLVLASEPEAHFAIVGDGAHGDEFKGLARQLGLDRHVTWTGLVEDPVAEGAYAAADIVMQLSRWEEAFGWVITEAMAFSRPVVATRAGGIPEIIEDGNSGFLVNRRQPAEAAERIVRLVRDPGLRTRMGQDGRRAVETRFDLKRNVAELIRLYGIAPRAASHDSGQARGV